MNKLIFSLLTAFLLVSCEKIKLNRLDVSGNSYLVRTQDNQYASRNFQNDSSIARFTSDSILFTVFTLESPSNLLRSSDSYRKNRIKIITDTYTLTIINGDSARFVVSDSNNPSKPLYFFRIP